MWIINCEENGQVRLEHKKRIFHVRIYTHMDKREKNADARAPEKAHASSIDNRRRQDLNLQSQRERLSRFRFPVSRFRFPVRDSATHWFPPHYRVTLRFQFRVFSLESCLMFQDARLMTQDAIMRRRHMSVANMLTTIARKKQLGVGI